MTTSQPYARATHDASYDAIVIGSGLGGLSAAALLATYAGKRVLVLERHYTLGGFTHVFRRPGYEWDVGVHYVGDMQPGTPLRALFDAVTDARLEWADIGDVYDRVAIGNDRFDFPAGRERLRAALKRSFPAEAVAIDRYFDAVRAVVSSTFAYYSEKALPPLVAAVAGPWLRRKFLRWADRTTREVLESLTRNERLIAVLTTQCGDYGLPPGESSFAIHALVANHYFEGGFYPVGGAGRIAETIVPLINAAGGQALVKAEVAEVVVERGRAVGVRMAADGAIIRAPLVISDAGIATTVARLLPPDAAARSGLSAVARALRPSVAHLGLYVGLRQTARELGLPRANLWVFRDEHHDRSFASAIAAAEAPLPFAYISFPSAKDPDFTRRHPGRATIDVITLAPYERFAQWERAAWKKRGTDYDALKERLAQELLAILYAHVPQVKGRIDTYELSTPLSTQTFCNYATGEIYGLAHTPARFRERRLRPRTGIPGFYLTGQDIVSCGIAGALMAGALTASAILGRNLIGQITARTVSTPPPNAGTPAIADAIDSAA